MANWSQNLSTGTHLSQPLAIQSAPSTGSEISYDSTPPPNLIQKTEPQEKIPNYIIEYFDLPQNAVSFNPKGQCYLNPLVPKRPSVDVFRIFLSKWRSSPQQFFLFKPPKWPLSISLSTGAYHEIKEKRLICEKQKTDDRFDSKKIFFAFLAGKTWECFSWWTKNFEKKIFFEIFEILGEIGLQFSATHRSAFFPMILWLAPDRKMLSGHLSDFDKKFCWGEHLLFNRKRRKTFTLGRSGTGRILPTGELMGLRNFKIQILPGGNSTAPGRKLVEICRTRPK